MPDRIITFKYAKDNLDAFKKQPIPDSLRTMKKSDVDDYINADMTLLTGYQSNQLVPEAKVVGINLQDFCYFFNNTVYDIYIQLDGKILVGGAFTQYKGITCNRIVRINPSGDIDNTFNSGIGFDSLGPTSESYAAAVYTITQDTDGKIMVGGNFDRYNGTTAIGIIRLNLDGTKDTSFNSSVFHDQTNNYAGPCFTIIRDSSYYYVSGGGSETNSISKLNLSGGQVGYATVQNIYQRMVKVGNVLYVANRYNGFVLVDANTMNVLETHNSFSTGISFTIIEGIYYHSTTNSLIVYGYFSTYKNAPVHKIAKISLSGVLDTAFAANTNAIFSTQGDIIVSAIGEDTSGNLYVGTMKAKYTDPQQVARVYKLNQYGTQVSGFNGTLNADSAVQTFLHSTIQGVRTLYVGGKLQKWNTTPVNNMIKVNPTTGELLTCSSPSSFNLTITFTKGKGMRGQLTVTVNGVSTNYTDPIYVTIPVSVGDQISVTISASGKEVEELTRSLALFDSTGTLFYDTGTFNIISPTFIINSSMEVQAIIDNPY